MKPSSFLTNNQCQTLLTHIQDHRTTHTTATNALRNYAITLVMLDAGLRIGEAVQLPKSSLFFQDRPSKSVIVLRHIAKGHRERIVPASARLQAAIEKLNRLHWRSLQVPPDGFAFFGRTFTNHITVRQVQRIIGSASVQAIGRAIHPHILRHTFATRMLQLTDIRTVQELLGHESLSSTQIYTHVTPASLTAAINNLDKTNGPLDAC